MAHGGPWRVREPALFLSALGVVCGDLWSVWAALSARGCSSAEEKRTVEACSACCFQRVEGKGSRHSVRKLQGDVGSTMMLWGAMVVS